MENNKKFKPQLEEERKQAKQELEVYFKFVPYINFVFVYIFFYLIY